MCFTQWICDPSPLIGSTWLHRLSTGSLCGHHPTCPNDPRDDRNSTRLTGRFARTEFSRSIKRATEAALLTIELHTEGCRGKYKCYSQFAYKPRNPSIDFSPILRISILIPCPFEVIYKCCYCDKFKSVLFCKFRTIVSSRHESILVSH